MNLIRAMLPSLALMVLMVLCIYPWGLATQARNMLPLVPLAAIIAMNLRLARAVPEWMAFCVGFVLDAMSGGPLGFWALVSLGACVLADQLAPNRGAALVGGWALGVVSLAALSVLQWVLVSLYTFALTPVAPLMRATAVAALVFPLVDVLLSPLTRRSALRDNGYLVRGYPR